MMENISDSALGLWMFNATQHCTIFQLSHHVYGGVSCWWTNWM